MDNLKSIVEKGDYDLVLSLTNDTQDTDALLYRAAALTGLGRVDEAMDIYKFKRKEFFYNNPYKTIQINFELRFTLNQFDEAYDDLDEFNTYPYVSQEVEELLSRLPRLIRENERASYVLRMDSPDKTINILESGSDIEVLSILDKINVSPREEYVPHIVNILSSNRHLHVRTYALILLVAWEYEKEVAFKGHDETIHNVIPSKLEPPFTGKIFDDFIYNIKSIAKDPSLANAAIRLLNDYTMLMYPVMVLNDDENNNNLMLVTLLSLASDYLGSGFDITSLQQKYNLNNEDIENMKNEIKTLTEGLKPLI